MYHYLSELLALLPRPSSIYYVVSVCVTNERNVAVKGNEMKQQPLITSTFRLFTLWRKRESWRENNYITLMNKLTWLSSANSDFLLWWTLHVEQISVQVHTVIPSSVWIVKKKSALTSLPRIRNWENEAVFHMLHPSEKKGGGGENLHRQFVSEGDDNELFLSSPNPP